MHEESLMRSLLRQVDELAHQHNAVAVEEIEVEIGPLSGVEPLLIEEAFQRLQESIPWPGLRLCVQQVGLDIRCNDCHRESQLPDFRFVCAHCGSTSLQIIRGDAFRLLNVKLKVEHQSSLNQA